MDRMRYNRRGREEAEHPLADCERVKALLC